jgi:hypothetical protein
MADLQLDWSSAEVSQGKLTVTLDGKPTDEWRVTFERTVQLLDRGTWPGIELSKQKIKVAEVEPGTEERLRFFLESAVQEANGEQPEDDEEDEDSEDEDSEDDEERDDSEEDPDREMADRFRSFASGSASASASEDPESDA